MTAHYRVRPAADSDLDDQAAYLAREASLDEALRLLLERRSQQRAPGEERPGQRKEVSSSDN